MQLGQVLSHALSPEAFHAAVCERNGASAMRQAMSQRAAGIARRFPQVKDRTLADAQLALDGKLVLPGTAAKPFFVGNPPDWFANPVGDEEYVWGLNRMFHWQGLLAAFSFTGEARYARKVATELADWIERCPRPAIDTRQDQAYRSFYSVDPWRSLEAGIRMYETWPWVIEHLLGTEFLPPDLLAKYATSLHEHAECIEQISPVFWPKADHNHYIMENLGLLRAACSFPELRNAEQWKRHAMRELERCAATQLTDDGGQIEGCPSYHNGCVYFFCLAAKLARDSGVPFSNEYTTRVRNALNYSLQTFRPSGTGVPWGDSDADLMAVQALLWEYLAFGETGGLRLIQSLIGREQLQAELLRSIWRIPDIDHLLADLDGPAPRPPLVSWQRELKQVAMRTSWDRDALSVFFACRSPVNNGHAHLDTMGFDFTAFGRPLLVDPGRFCYREVPERRMFKSAAYHTTLTVDGRDPYAYIDTWKFGPQKEGTITRVIERPGLLAAEAMQRNFEPAIHRRLVAIIDSAFLLVLDALTGLGPKSSVQIWKHIDSTAVTWDPAKHLAVADGPVKVLICATGNLSGSLHPGQIADVCDVTRDSTRLLLEDSTGGAADRAYATLIVPFRSDAPSITGPSLTRGADQVACNFRVQGKDYRIEWSQRDIVAA